MLPHPNTRTGDGGSSVWNLIWFPGGVATKRDLGVSYLLGSGLGLVATLTWFFLLSDEPAVGTVVATLTAAILSGTIVFIGYWMYHAGIAGDTVWTVARWSAVGLAIPASLGLLVILVDPDTLFRTVVPGVFVNIVAVGGVVGLLVGLVLEMHREQVDLRRLNQRNRVLNRVLRHNIRNDMNVMSLHVDLLDDALGDDANGSVDALRDKIDEVVSTSDMARRIDELDADAGEDGPVDVVEVVEERIDIVRSTHPDVSLSVDLPEEAWVAAGPVLASVVDNVVENAIEHNDGDPSVHVSVEADEVVRVRVDDDGPGIPEREVEMFENGEGSQLDHGNGLGLWLVKWIVEGADGDLRFDSSPAGGTRVVIELPAADERPRPQASG
ncbi:MAG TPA: HAMP domain-containing sensor histidine kinase [Halobacteriales archaeon]|nr:HAMP domain-containing sensor histidine kinase [Halobacteriales archaeon]